MVALACIAIENISLGKDINSLNIDMCAALGGTGLLLAAFLITMKPLPLSIFSVGFQTDGAATGCVVD